ncbi:uncharacterized protein [Cicer arietinum]|uniref:Uncharacterized protein LOC113786371 n=1 Tax=Cicer arietinum TaxID=3827 RepID=A0A3Q7X8I8_CICAR|nr:uncharacterized protein LOC113786371 [Cicer arietinum]
MGSNEAFVGVSSTDVIFSSSSSPPPSPENENGRWICGYNTVTHTYHLLPRGNANDTGDVASIRKSVHILEVQSGHHDQPPSPSPSPSPAPINNNDVIMATPIRAVAADDKTTKKEKNKNKDGRIHSLPHKKYGPYTCSECYEVFATSQKFACHVTSSHYKGESEEQRKKRYMSRVRNRSNLQIQKVDDGITVVAAAAAINDDQTIAVDPTPLPIPIKVKSEPQDSS